MGRRLVVLGSAPAFAEVADEEGVEDAISSVVPGPLLSGVLGRSGAGTGCKDTRSLCGEGFRDLAYGRLVLNDPRRGRASRSPGSGEGDKRKGSWPAGSG